MRLSVATSKAGSSSIRAQVREKKENLIVNNLKLYIDGISCVTLHMVSGYD